MVTAKVVCRSKTEYPDENGVVNAAVVELSADYADGANAEWAVATPHLALNMKVAGSVAAFFQQGKHYSLCLEAMEDANDGQEADNPGVGSPPPEELLDHPDSE